MGLLSRFCGILTGNLNALLDQVENPAVMSTQILRDLEDELVKARRSAAAAIAAERRMVRELELQRAEADRWQARAREALTGGREDLARRALAHKKEHDNLAASLETQTDAARRTSEKIKASLRLVEARLAEAQQKQRSILTRFRAAQARQEFQRLVGPGIALGGSPGVQWERLESQLQSLEDQLEAQDELQPTLSGLERELAELETKHDLDVELEALRQEIQGGNQ